MARVHRSARTQREAMSVFALTVSSLSVSHTGQSVLLRVRAPPFTHTSAKISVKCVLC